MNMEIIFYIWNIRSPKAVVNTDIAFRAKNESEREDKV